MFRKFPTKTTSPTPDDEADLEDSEHANLSDRQSPSPSSIKPRLLFPSPAQRRAREIHTNPTLEDDEEAITDIEEPIHIPTDGNMHPSNSLYPFSTPAKTVTEPPTPPTTG